MQPKTKMSSGQATFDLKAAREIATDPNFYGNAPYLAANLNAALDEIEQLHAELDRMAEMFAKDVYIESANLEPSHYDLRLKGKGCMLLAGQLTRMFYDSGGKNFITSTIEHQFSDGKDVFALTIQKMSGEDTPGQKIERQAKRIAGLGAALEVEKSAHEETKYADSEAANQAFSQIAKQRSALKKLGQTKRERGKALVEERARRICHAPGDPVGHWPRYEPIVVDEAREQLRREENYEPRQHTSK